MKATTYYCDRCGGEGKPAVPAPHKAWIRTSLGGRTLRLDVCEEHLAAIVGGSANGARPQPSKRGERVWSTRGGQQLERKRYERLLPWIAKHPRFSFESAVAYLGEKGKAQGVGRVLRLLVDDGKLERYMAGVYQQPGVACPEPASVEIAATAVLRLVKAEPGMRGTALAALVGISSERLWKPTVAYLRERKEIRTKGAKSATRYYPA